MCKPIRLRAFSACAGARSSTRWAGTTTASRPNGACRTSTACVATRTWPTSGIRTAGVATQGSRFRSRVRTFSNCPRRLVAEDEKAFEALWRRLGLSVDWTLTYTTVGTRPVARASAPSCATSRGRGVSSRRADLVGRRHATAVAQAELEDREVAGAYHALRFHRVDGAGDILIDTTRPELLAACVALVAHPEDERYQPLFGSEVRLRLRRARFGARAPTRGSREGNGHRDDLHVR